MTFFTPNSLAFETAAAKPRALNEPVGFRLSSLKSSAELNYKAEEYENIKAVSDKALEIHTSFWNLYKAQKLVQLTEASYKAAKGHVRDTENFIKNGMAIESDLLKLKVHEANMEMKLIESM